MEITAFKGRKRELALLRQDNWRHRGTLIALYGRRRVGKTALVEKAFEHDTLWKFEGLEGASPFKQLEHFYFSLAQYTADSSPKRATKSTTWEEAFRDLDAALGDQPCVVFFDEFQWMASMRSPLVSIFKWAWDNYFSKRKNCRIILCGSISSFMVRQVIKSKALYGRVDLEIHLEPFTLRETWTYFENQRIPAEVLDIHMVFGGIPQYLEELQPKESFIQNLEQMAFSPQGYFFREYQRLFISHFSKNQFYETILRALSKRASLTPNELARAVRITSGGRMSVLLEDLELAGFIERFTPLDKPENSRLVRYRIVDEFLEFYFQFIAPNQKAILARTIKGFELLTGPSFDQWRGMAFERLCRKEALLIAKALGFSGIRFRAGSWFRPACLPRAQIDLMFDRADRVLTLCEAKYTNTLDARTLIAQAERAAAVLNEHYPRRSVQKVLLVAHRLPIPEKVGAFFDAVLAAEDIFFSSPEAR